MPKTRMPAPETLHARTAHTRPADHPALSPAVSDTARIGRRFRQRPLASDRLHDGGGHRDGLRSRYGLFPAPVAGAPDRSRTFRCAGPHSGRDTCTTERPGQATTPVLRPPPGRLQTTRSAV